MLFRSERLLATLTHLRDLGNTVLVVEHDEEAIRAADHIIDIGPGAGVHGGNIVASGSLKDITGTPDSLTGQYLSGKRAIAVPAARTPCDPDRVLSIRGASGNNLKEVDLDIPLRAISCILGPSGSGHRALIERVLYGESRARYMQALAPSQRAGLAGHFRIDVDSVSGLPPVITYLQGERIPSGTVASYMGIEQLLAHHFLVHGQWRCPHCGGRCVSYRAEEVEGAVLEQIGEGQITVLAPLRETAVGMGESLWGELRRAGYVRVRIDGEIHRLDGDTGALNTDQVEVVVDRLRPGGGDSRRFIEAVRSARAIGKGSSLILDADDRLWPMNQSLTCQTCALVLDTPSQEMLLESDSRAQDLYVAECSWSSVGASSVQAVDALLALTEEKTVRSVLATLNRLGLDLLPLGQPLSTLSHSEWQRLRLAFCLSSGMAGILYAFEGIISCVEGVLRQSVAACLQRLVEGGNTVLLVDAAPEAQRIARSVWEFSEGRCVERVDGVESATTEIDFPIGEGARWQVQGEGEWGRVDLDLPQGAIIGIVGEASCGKTRFMREVLESTLRERSASYRACLALRKPRVHVPVGALGGKTVFEELGIHGAVAEQIGRAHV